MKLDNKLMIKILKEEYDKRINQYLDEVETKAKHNETDGELVFLAGGLKVKNRAGFTFTINNIKQLENGEIFVYLTPPGEKDNNIAQSKAFAQINDSSKHNHYQTYSDISEDAKEKSGKVNKISSQKDGEILKPSDKAKNKKSLVIDVDSELDSYREENGFVVVTLKQLERDFTL